MESIISILQAAQQRAKSLNLAHEGALDPQETHQLLQFAHGAKVVDVRTRAEFDWVGGVTGAIVVEWANSLGMKPNPHFIAQLEPLVDKESLVIFLCRSGVRSPHPAISATSAGYTDSYNIIGDFEGDKNSANRRNSINGWRRRASLGAELACQE